MYPNQLNNLLYGGVSTPLFLCDKLEFIGELMGVYSRLPLSGCGSPVETSAKQKHRPNRQVRPSCLRSRLRGSQFIGKLSLPPSFSYENATSLVRGRHYNRNAVPSFCVLRFALCILHLRTYYQIAIQFIKYLYYQKIGEIFGEKSHLHYC